MQLPVAAADVTGVQMLRALRDQPGLVGLLGDWHSGGDVVAFEPVRVLPPTADPFAALSTTGGVHGRSAFGGGWIGYLGYQVARTLEALPAPHARPAPLPDHHLAFYDHVLRRSRAGWVVESLPGSPPERTAVYRAHVERALARRPTPEPYECGPFISDVTGEEHAGAVTAALEHIRDGDVFQVNVCRRLSATFTGDPLDLFCDGFTHLSPRFAGFMRLPDGAVASLSPELFLRRTGNAVLTSPIKGTASLESGPDVLESSVKDRAENLMIVDLMRNDLGRVSLPGTVTVEALARPQRHVGVHHLVSDIRSVLAPGTTDGDLLRATFPPGSCTGAPKIRAMEIISDLERTTREIYTGAIGFASPLAGSTFNVAIRTFEFAGGSVWLGAGGGVVADSDPAAEAHETLIKARPLLDAIGARFDDALLSDWHHAPATSPAAGRPDPALGVFTTLLVRHGAPVDLEPHLARLSASVQACYGQDAPTSLRGDILHEAARRQGLHRLRVQLVPAGRALVCKLTAVAVDGVRNDPWRLATLVLQGGLGAHKWSDRRLLTAPAGGAVDVLLVEPDGTVLEAGRANVFAVVDGAILTPALDGRILPGIVRGRVLSHLANVGVDVHEGRVTLEDLAQASEVFVTNSVVGVRAVSGIDGAGNWPIGPVARRLHTAMAG